MFRWTVYLKEEGRRYYYHTAVAVGDKLYFFGNDWKNEPRSLLIGVDVFNTVTLLWRRLAQLTPGRGKPQLEVVPSSRYGHTAVLVGDVVYIWGGRIPQTPSFCNVLYAFDADASRWFRPAVSGSVPEGRCGHSACVLGKVMFIHGGGNNPMGLLDDTHKLDTATMVWSALNYRGTAPMYHSATILGTKMFVFGGLGDQWENYNRIQVFDTETNEWTNTTSAHPLPDKRWYHSAFTYNGELYILGGYVVPLLDLWKFNPETFSWKEIKPKGHGPLKMPGSCCCVVGDRVFLFGGVLSEYSERAVLDLSPTLKTLCKLAVVRCGLELSELPHDVVRELRAEKRKPMIDSGLDMPFKKLLTIDKSVL